MLVAQLLPFAKNLCTRKWSDEDIVEDVQFLRDELNTNFQSLTLALLSLRSHTLPTEKL
jgi:V-type H+-transporting ATPase subunit H